MCKIILSYLMRDITTHRELGPWGRNQKIQHCTCTTSAHRTLRPTTRFPDVHCPRLKPFVYILSLVLHCTRQLRKLGYPSNELDAQIHENRPTNTCPTHLVLQPRIRINQNGDISRSIVRTKCGFRISDDARNARDSVWKCAYRV